MNTKLKIMITHSILNENARFNLQHALCTKIYQSHMIISRISSIDFYLDDDAAVESARIWLGEVETDDQ